jgi:Zn-dependent peptidase ImmA (M78 family)
MARAISGHCEKKFAHVFCDGRFHGREYLTTFVPKAGARLVLDRSLPGEARQAAVMFVSGHPFIIIDKSVMIESSTFLLSLAHELGHVVLEHGKRLSFVVHGFSETVNDDGREMQLLYHSELELEANLAAMMLVVPDAYLNRLVEETIWIRTNAKAKEHDLPTNWMAARVELYRKMYGYERTMELFKNKPKDPFSQTTVERWELTDQNLLEQFLPKMAETSFGGWTE